MKKLICTIVTMMLVVASYAQNQLLPNLVYSKEPAVIKGQLKGMNTDNPVKQVVVSCLPSWASDMVDTVRVNADGSFECKVNVNVTSRVELDVEGLKTIKPFIVNPGQEMKIAVDMVEDMVTCEGSFAELNNSMANYFDEYREGRLNADINGQNIFKLRGMTVLQYREKLMELYDNMVTRLNEDKRLSAQFREYMMPYYQFLTIALMSGYDRLLKYANGGEGEFTQPDGYYDVVKDWNFTAQNGYLYTSAGTVESIAAQLTEQTGKSFTYPVYARQTIAARKYMTELDNFKTFTTEQLNGIKVQCPAFEQDLLKLNEITKAKIEENAKNHFFSIKEISQDLKGEDVFNAIVKDYKGKMVLVDFWATWCGPCKAAMKTILPVKEELWGKVAFVYVTGETSQKALWNKMIPDIHGDHYYVTAAQWETLLKQFDAQGIPAYVVVDKEGKVVTNHIGYPGNDVIKDELAK